MNKRKNIVNVAATQLENGYITSSDYVTELSNENQAELNKKIHEIQFMIAQENLKITTGN